MIQHTDFARAGLAVEQHATTVGKAAAVAQQVSSQRLARLHGLKCKIAAHRLGNIVAVFAALYALLRNVLDLGSPVQLSVVRTWVAEKGTNRFWNQI